MMDKIYMMSYDQDKAKIKITEYPVIRESELTVTIKNGVNREYRIRRRNLDKMTSDTGYTMQASSPDKAHFMSEIIKRMEHSCEVVTGILQMQLENKDKAEELLDEIRRKSNA
jgi:two-component sensor histidine kinase